MKNMLTKLLAGLLAVMLLMTSSVALMEEAPVAAEAAPVEESLAPADDAAPTDDAVPAEDATDETTVPADDATAPTDEDYDETVDDAPIFAEAFEAAVSEEDAVELDEADDELNQNDALDPADDNQIEYDLDLLLFASEDELKQVFPDDAFRAWVVKTFDEDKSGSLSDEECAAFATRTEISFDGYDRKAEIKSLDGITSFTALKKLDASGTGVEMYPTPVPSEYGGYSLPTYNLPQLTDLLFNDCTALTYVGLGNNPPANGPVTNLEVRNCTNLTQLDIYSQSLTNLDVSGCTNLAIVSCAGNKSLTSLDLRDCPKLATLITESYPTRADSWGTDYGSYDSATRISFDTGLEIKPAPKPDENVIKIDKEHFPDDNFRDFVSTSHETNPNHDEWLQGSEIQNCQDLNMIIVSYDPGISYSGIGAESLEGIELLTNLSSLNCSYNPLKSLDVSKNTELATLYVKNTIIEELNLQNTKLCILCITSNPQLSSVDIRNCPELVKCVKEGYKEDVTEDGITFTRYECWSGYRLQAMIEVDPTLNLIYGEEEKNDEEKKEDTSTPATTPAAAVTAPASTSAEPVNITKTPASAKAKAGKKGKVTVSWKKIKKNKKTKALLKQITGVQVQYSTDPNFAANTVTKNLGKKKTKVTLKGLQKKTVYYIRVRYVGTGGVSNWSAVKKVKTKK